ncbi:DUF2332 domain-containing protein [Halobacillus sp. A1]|uniref:DUF2332 domain-containing protein n=1 Tax=Halobacillus sp. A1 TaxID=2880262 RepID=UPI0020A6B99C|nr:DUF2332 domain-containing protein [Halobacillus sp. A1]MCP3030919.1 DUF2332 domain-containing protein [Halobacillus sp. A1]
MSLTDIFETFSQEAQQLSSSLYGHLSNHIAHDKELLELCSYARKGQPAPNLLFGSVQFLLKGSGHPLSNYYSNLTENPLPPSDAFNHFKDFCQLHQKEIKVLLQNRLVQTNEVRRCAFLYPCFNYVYDTIRKPLALIEIGTSAGLQLLWDKYSYTYDEDSTYGSHETNVHITSKIKSSKKPKISQNPSPVSDRFGLDLHINSVEKVEDLQWLEALIWPEHRERRQLFQQAAAAVQATHLHLIEGDGVDLLPQTAEGISKDSIVCVFHTHVANQMNDATKQKLLNSIDHIGKERDVAHLYNNIEDQKLHLDTIIHGEKNRKIVGDTDGHGRWFTWEMKTL